jgi:amidohydrolase
MSQSHFSELLSANYIDLKPYEEIYKYLHANPELSHCESETSTFAVAHLARLSAFEIHTNIGGYGFAGVLNNGPGTTILLRADMDGLPVLEKTGLPYASTKKMLDKEGIERPVMHACGHDMHITCLLAAAEILVKMRKEWQGTLIVLFQPEEERGTGAKAMVDGGLYDKIPVPDYVLGQHVMALKSGLVGSKVGTIMAAADSYKITLFGRGGHGSMPHRTIDPVMMAANLVVRLQNIVSREVDPSDMAVVTVGSMQAGHTENIIADFAEIGLDIRSIKPATREKVLASIRRILHAEYIASGSDREPTMVESRRFPPTYNDEDMAGRLATSFGEFFGNNFDPNIARTNASEDVTILGTSQGKPCLFWFFGGVDEELWVEKEKAGRLMEDIPGNHSPFFAPVIQPTLKTGVDALCVAALTFLKK